MYTSKVRGLWLAFANPFRWTGFIRFPYFATCDFDHCAVVVVECAVLASVLFVVCLKNWRYNVVIPIKRKKEEAKE